jgi:quercetin dioxygenase-like cupin family protein
MDCPDSQDGVRVVSAINQITHEQGKQVEQETEESPGNLIVFDVRKLARFREEGPNVQVLSDIGTARLVLFAFKAGQQLKEHTTSSQILVQVLRGRITFTAAGNSTRLQAGMVLQVEAQVPHQVVALTQAVILVTMTPSPAYHSLDREVFQHLTPLVMRTTDASEKGG